MIGNIWKYKHTTKIIITIVVISLIVLWVRKTQKEKEFQLLMEAINDKSTSTGTVQDLGSNLAFDENYWRKFPDFSKKHSFGRKEGDIITEIYNAKGNIYDDENSVISIFSKLRSKSEVSYLSWQFNVLKKRKLIDYLNSFIDKDNMIKINDIINRLPAN